MVNEFWKDYLSEKIYYNMNVFGFVFTNFSENLRINSVVFALNKICTKEFKLPPQYTGGKDGPIIKVGMPIAIPVSAIHK